MNIIQNAIISTFFQKKLPLENMKTLRGSVDEHLDNELICDHYEVFKDTFLNSCVAGNHENYDYSINLMFFEKKLVLEVFYKSGLVTKLIYYRQTNKLAMLKGVYFSKQLPMEEWSKKLRTIASKTNKIRE